MDGYITVDNEDEIARYLFARENRMEDYLPLHPRVNANMRLILVDWLHDVWIHFKLLTATWYRGVSILDWYLSRSEGQPREKLQLLGCVALSIASKVEEIYPPEMNDWIYIADHSFKRDEMVKMEQLVLETLDYDVVLPTPYDFWFLRTAASGKEHALWKFLTQMSLRHYRMAVDWDPSEVCASAISIAREVLDSDCKETIAELAIGFNTSEKRLMQCRDAIYAIANRECNQRSAETNTVWRVYDRRFFGVALLFPIKNPSPWKA